MPKVHIRYAHQERVRRVQHKCQQPSRIVLPPKRQRNIQQRGFQNERCQQIRKKHGKQRLQQINVRRQRRQRHVIRISCRSRMYDVQRRYRVQKARGCEAAPRQAIPKNQPQVVVKRHLGG